MKLRLFTGVAVLFFLMQTSAFALSGQQVYNKYKQTEKKMERSMKTLIMVVEMDTAGTVSETTIYKKGKKMRVDAVIKKSANPMMGQPGQKMVSISDGITTTVFHPMMGKMSSPTDNEDIANIRQIKYIKKEVVSGIKCHKIKVLFNAGDKETLWISAKDNVLVKEKGDGGSVTINTDFRKTKGFMLPYKTTTYDDGAVEQTTIVKSVKTGVRIAASKFDASKVKGYDKALDNTVTKATDQATQALGMMGMVMEIQRLRMNGETEKAEAMAKKLQQMQMGQ